MKKNIIPQYEDNRRIELFADISRGAAKEELVKQYFDAGFTVWVMTEDDAHISDENGKLTEQYLNNIKTISKYGEVWPRNVVHYPHCWINKETAVVNPYGRTDVTIPARTITTELNDAGNVTGYYQWDEPHLSTIDKMLPLVEWHNTYAKDKVWHVNLLPSYGSRLFGMKSLTEYIQHYIDEVLSKVESPKNLGLDNYPLVKTEDGEYILRKTYLEDLLTLAQMTKEYNEREEKTSEAKLGFCIQSFCDKWIRDPESTADITFQVNCCLAMGARYLEYFLYCPIAHMIGLVDVNDNQLPVYHYVKAANEELNKWDHVILAFEWQGVITVGGEEEHENEEAFLLLEGRELSKLKMIEEVKCQVDTLVGEFIDKNGYYGYMTVNYTEPSKNKVDQVTYTFKDEVEKALVYQNGEPTVYDMDVNHELTLQIPTGGGAFVIPCLIEDDIQ